MINCNIIIQEDFFFVKHNKKISSIIYNMKIGKVIRELRKEKGYTQAQLAKEIGVSQKAVDYWERDVNEPKLSYIMALVKTFDVSYDEFFAEIE